MNRRSPATHGTRRTNADKRRSIETLLSDLEWSKWTDNKIAKLCGVHNETVGIARRSLADSASDTRIYTDRYGRRTTMDTSNIGQRVSIVTTARTAGATTT